jgi:5-methyltetrahydropteroyltriglutamate--homocysteine methyltransferase
VLSRIKTTVVGSYPVLPWMVGNPSRLVLRDAVMVVLKAQELAGLDLVTDGELIRFDPSHPETNGMVDYFISRLDGIRKERSPADFERNRADQAAGYELATAGVVVGEIGEGTLNLPLDCELARVLTKSRFKFTCTGPHMLARLLNNTFYPDLPELAMAVAAVLRRQLELVEADTVQLDEASIAGYPQDTRWAADAINHILFRDLDPKIGLGIGVIDIKDNQVESPELIASRIERIVKTLGDRLRYVHPDCGFWMLQRSVVDRKIRALVEGRDLFEGRL